MNASGFQIELRHVGFSYDGGETWALDDVNLGIRAGERVCIVGANGSGKSTLLRVMAGLSAPDTGSVTLLGHTVFTDEGGADADAYACARRGIGAVFQNPEDQIVTTVTADDVAFGPENLDVPANMIGARVHASLSCVDMLTAWGADPTHMSGGEQQRIAIAGMLAIHSRLLVLDEPTAMLDPQARAEVLALLDRIQASGTTLVIVSHLPEELRHADRIVHIEHGRITGEDCAQHMPQHDHHFPSVTTFAQLDTLARHVNTEHAGIIGAAPTAVVFDDVSFRYERESADVLSHMNLRIPRGCLTAIMGPNGSGKTTFARLLCALDKPRGGRIVVEGIDVTQARRRERRRLRRVLGFVMQHPERQLFAETVADDVAFGPTNQGLDAAQVRERVDWALDLVGVSDLRGRNPFELSGGQQRLVAIAGIIACDPSVLVLDEPCAGLDTSASRHIERLMENLRHRGVTVILICHDPDQVDRLADQVILFGNEQQGRAHADSGGEVQREVLSPTDTGYSWVSGLDPRVKIVCILTVMCAAFAMNTWAQLAVGVLLTAALWGASRVGFTRLLRSVRGFLVLFAVMGALNIGVVHTGDVLVRIGPLPITTGGVSVAIIYTTRFAIVLILGALLLETTTPTRLTAAFSSLLSPLRRLHWHTQETALVLSLALRFVPTLAQEALSIRDAQAIRGGSIESGSLPQRVNAMCATIIPVFAGAIRHANNLSLALQARSFEEGRPRSTWHAMHIRGRDIVFMTLTVTTLAAIIAMNVFTI
ncbi:energy-coupling factor transporter ATPase [Bifidobacterium animalis]|uniref:energy-coupling factor transporter ATPase n=1 Tax=Bifidobacterium animalis TaxID=28025 RepID=UPI003F8FB051